MIICFTGTGLAAARRLANQIGGRDVPLRAIRDAGLFTATMHFIR